MAQPELNADHVISQKAALNAQKTIWSRSHKYVDESDEGSFNDDQENEDEEDDGWVSEYDDDNELVHGLSAWDALGENFVHELNEVGEYWGLFITVICLISL